MIKDDRRLSSLDLFGRDWVLLAGSDRWGPAAARAREATGIELECLRIRVDFNPSNPEAFRAAFGQGTAGASLIRPDGYVAWRSIDPPDVPLSTVSDALGRASSAASPPVSPSGPFPEDPSAHRRRSENRSTAPGVAMEDARI